MLFYRSDLHLCLICSHHFPLNPGHRHRRSPHPCQNCFPSREKTPLTPPTDPPHARTSVKRVQTCEDSITTSRSSLLALLEPYYLAPHTTAQSSHHSHSSNRTALLSNHSSHHSSPAPCFVAMRPLYRLRHPPNSQMPHPRPTRTKLRPPQPSPRSTPSRHRPEHPCSYPQRHSHRGYQRPCKSDWQCRRRGKWERNREWGDIKQESIVNVPPFLLPSYVACPGAPIYPAYCSRGSCHC